ncbi:MAG: hypothetical protein ACRD2T_11210 [Thermoanaerobaculia bacterium]
MSRKGTRIVVALALLAALATAPAAAWGGRDRHRDEARIAPSPRTWMMEAVERLWTGLVGIWEGEGASPDPNG